MQLLVLTLLLRLSGLPEAIPDMLAAGLVPVAVEILSCASAAAVELALRLLHNVAFHREGRAAIAAADSIAQVRGTPHHCLLRPN